MKTTSILKYAMVVLAIAFSFNACIEPADNPEETLEPAGNPEETTEYIPTAVIVTTTITEDLARFSNVQLFENGVAVKTFSLDDLECTITRAVKDCPDTLTYVLNGEFNGAPIDTTSKYTYGWNACYTLVYETAAGEEVLQGAIDLASSYATYAGTKVEKCIEAFFPYPLGTIRVPRQ